MKFNLSDFLQLDTKELLAVNGGSPCSGPTTGPSNNASDPTSPSYGSGGNDGNGGGGGSGADKKNSNQPVKTVQRSTGTWEFYGDGSGVWTDNDGEKHAFGPVNHINDSIKNEASNNISASSSGGSCSTPTSNNHNGQGPSTTSSNPGGNQSKDTKTHSGGGTCTKTGGQSPVNPNPTNPDDVTSGGGTCSSKNDTDKVSGMFGQITDGSYADELTMQYYIKDFPWTNGEIIDSFMNGTYIGSDGKEHSCKFSLFGCKEIGSAMIGSEFLNENVSPMTIQNNCDLDKDGNLSAYEIATGLNALLDDKYGDIFDVKYEDITDNISLDKLEQISNKTDTYVLGFAQNCHTGHWVVLEGYSTDSKGNIVFNYDETSSNDIANNRTFVLGLDNEAVASEKYAITRIQTFTKVTK